MPKIDKTGTYRDFAGKQFFFTEGTVVTAEQKAELELVEAGRALTDGERRQQEIAERRAAIRAEGAAPENKALPRAPQTKTRRADEAE